MTFALSIVACILAADFITGLGHWIEDTWTAPGRSAWLNRVLVEPNIDHHRRPNTMNPADWWVTNGATIALSFAAAAVLAIARVSAWQPWLVLALVSHSNQIHAWAHSRRVPAVIALLQRIGAFQSVAHHGLHHRRPYATRFCTMTNYLNPVLDAVHFWRGLERVGMFCGLRVNRATAARGGF